MARPEHLALHAAVLETLGAEAALVVHGAGGADELTLQGPNSVRGVGALSWLAAADAATAALQAAPVAALRGGDVATNSKLLHAILGGEAGPLRDAVVLNAAAALLVAGRASTVAEGAAQAQEALDSGAAQALLERWAALSQQLAP